MVAENKTQAEIATEMGVPQPAVARWMRGRVMPREENLLRLARALGKTPEETILFLRKRREETQKKCGKAPLSVSH